MKIRRVVQWIAESAALMMVCAAAEPFPQPAEGPVPFRLDRLPLGTDGISQLAKAICEMAEVLEAETAVERRAVAQMLAVSIALEPENDRAMRLLRELPERDFRPKGDGVEVERQRARVWQLVEWLETPDAGIDGQALAACLKDVLEVVDPRHPRSEELRGMREQAAWSGWVPVLAEYESRREPAVEEEENHGAEGNKREETEQDGPAKIRLAEASVPALFWKNEAKVWPPKWRLMPQLLTMKAEIRPTAEWEIEQGIQRKTLLIGSHSESHALQSVEARVKEMLRSKFGPLPADLVLEIRHPELDQSVNSGNRHALSGVCGALAYAAFSGVEPTGLIVGAMDEDGGFVMTTDFWGQLRPLAAMSGLRLVVPAESEEVLMAFLALEKPEFFFNNEVLLAKDIEEVVKLAAKKPEPGLDGVLGRFREIRDRKGAQDVRIYIGNSFIRQRLQAIHQEEPRHLSSKALVIQALGNRPTTLPRSVLGSELLKAVEFAGWVRRTEYIEPRTSKPLAAAYEQCRDPMDALTRYVKKEDQDLMDKAVEVALAVRDLDRATKGRGEYWEVEGNIRSKQRALGRVYDDFSKFIGDIIKSDRRVAASRAGRVRRGTKPVP